MKMNNKAQVWVETAIYTLIGLTIIAILLVVITPQIEKIKDKSIISQTIDALNAFDKKISEIEENPGNIRIVELKVSKGKLEINPENATVTYVLEDTNLELSQPGQEIPEGNILLLTESKGKRFNVYLKLKYDNLDMTFNSEKQAKTLQAGSTPYKIQMENVGDNLPSEKTHIDLRTL
jgi:hypothetical protein